ncbi:polysaccharide deacetylase family protein [Patescibacteria group bacterium]|nr:polysaccharide deacetylase family protein [Patescibacteria group bacterium]
MRFRLFFISISLGLVIVIALLGKYVFLKAKTNTFQSPVKKESVKKTPFVKSIIKPALGAGRSAKAGSSSAKPAPSPVEKLHEFCLRVPVLMYHHIQPESIARQLGQTSLTVDNGYFDQQMAYLVSRGYTTITAEQLAKAIINHSPLPSKSIVITIDDGYQDIYTYAYPIIQKYHVLVNLMIPTGLMDNPDYLRWQELKDMQKSGLVNIYDHTWSHYPLAEGPVSKDQFEILTSKNQLQQNLGNPVDIFAYPYGSGENTLWVWNLLRSDGFIAAFSSLPGFYQCPSFVMSLRRTRIGNAPLYEYGL